ncbi:M48 family metalloprotease [Haloprofundus halobius]|uniref:M48 family metalloprotease n=1 Tax=Haloprofundus halobius TaxID=2876194 RepID=UPI001CC9C61B|nr:M48 family metalloprotease [Haloprofundus halobius]
MTASTPLATRDAALSRRILTTLALVVALDTAFVAVVGLLLAPWLAPLGATVAVALGVQSVPAFVRAAVAAAPVVALFLWLQLRYTRRQTIAAVGARVVGDDEFTDLRGRVTRLCSQGDLTPPTLAVAETPVPNSFTVSGPRESVLVVSTGLLGSLSDEELDAVIAHELAHVKNRDATVMTLATFLPAVTSGEFSPLEALTPRGRSRGAAVAVLGVVAVVLFGLSAAGVGGGLDSLSGLALVVLFSLLFGGIVLGALTAPVASLSGRLSRSREFAADRAAALLTGNPAAVAAAIRRLDAAVSDAPDRDLRRSAGVRVLCFLPHGFATGGADDAEEFSLAVETHPATTERVARLRELAGELERSRDRTGRSDDR